MDNNLGTNLPPTPAPAQAPLPMPPKKWYRHKGIIAIIVLALVTTLVTWAYFKFSQPKTDKQVNTTVKGIVISNYQGCSHDDGCVLTIQTNAGKKISAVYGGGLTANGACYLSSGFELAPGDQVELYGTYTDQNTFSLCGAGAYIKKTTSPESNNQPNATSTNATSSSPQSATTTPLVSYDEPNWQATTSQITWIDAQTLPDLQILVPYTPNPNDDSPGFTSHESEYNLVGHINTGKYAGGDIITAIFGGNDNFYVLLKSNDNYIALTKYQYAPVKWDDFVAVPKSDSTYDIPDLDYPNQINSPTKEITFGSPDPTVNPGGGFGGQTSGVKLFTDPKWGGIYDEGDVLDRTKVGLPLPDGLWIIYTMNQFTSNPKNFNFSNGLTLDDYTFNPGGGCDQGWYGQDNYPSYKPADLNQVGNIYGLPVSEVINQSILKALYTKMDGGKADPFYFGMKGVSLQAFLASHPLLVWNDAGSRQILLMNSKYSDCNGGLGKPVIYLYPERAQKVSVKLQTPGSLTESIPSYNGGWAVYAEPDGTLTDLATGRQYPYLYWESLGGNGYSMPQEGFSVALENLHPFLESVLAKYGLNAKERSDFEAFWVPRLQNKKSAYYFITFTTTDKMQEYAPLNITPSPDNLIRVFMDYRLSPEPVKVTEPNIQTPKRDGFTVVEWGGALK